ncbi:glycine cleavage system protein GcvH [Candidatus Endomicrobiellum devescovinae]|jgi:glycine cleavage system H protein|uniref:glycine cleavage system protein GcvH n=1 Tax=Candidatus Endomicrobiellum devescovinae TaxID=3242322 RepID=UPI0028336ACF|nr:glycine cleavage system protein GcvH [Endomicrobium sp.]MDR2818546.1 glycine cleavage system protein GcvH [Endomicrobium sp.]
MNIPQDLLYTKTHEWVKIEGNKVKVGITDFAQHEITDVVHVELPEVGRDVKKEQPAAVIESVKSAFDIYAPVSGKIIETNNKVLGSPELVNNSPYEEGYLFAIEFSNEKELGDLLKADDYKKLI